MTPKRFERERAEHLGKIHRGGEKGYGLTRSCLRHIGKKEKETHARGSRKLTLVRGEFLDQTPDQKTSPAGKGRTQSRATLSEKAYQKKRKTRPRKKRFEPRREVEEWGYSESLHHLFEKMHLREKGKGEKKRPSGLSMNIGRKEDPVARSAGP